MLRPSVTAAAAVLFSVAVSVGIASVSAESNEEIVRMGGKGASEFVVTSDGGGKNGNKPAKGRKIGRGEGRERHIHSICFIRDSL